MEGIRKHLLGYLLIILILPVCQDVWAAKAPKRSGPSSAAECSVCHVDWIVDFQKKGVDTLIPYETHRNEKTGKQKISSTRRLCFTCHDGFVNDSRFQFREGSHDHPIGVKPSKKIRMVKSEEGAVYPLNEDGKLYCGTCHTAHGNDWNRSESALFMRSKNVNSSLCIDCHADKIDEEKNNHPMARFKNKIPAMFHKTRARFGKRKKVICQTCHLAHDSAGKNMLVTSGKKSGLCTSCHENKKNVVGSDHDMSKHSKRLSNKKRKAVKENGACSGCHVNHGGNAKPLLAIDQNNSDTAVWDQCLSCHSKDGIAGETSIGKHSHPVDVSIKNVGIHVRENGWISSLTDKSLKPLPLFDEKGRSVDYDGNVRCPTCHDTHNVANTGNSFLRIAQGKNSELCTNCHIRQGGIINSKHNINLYDPKQHKLANAKHKAQQGICTACHSTHKAKTANMLSLLEEDGSRSVSMLDRVCEHCHNKNGAASDALVPDHSHPNSVRLDDDMEGVKLPIFSLNGKRVKDHGKGKMECSTCHDIHVWDSKKPGSRAGRNMDAKANNGNSFLRLPSTGDSQLCIACHKKEGQIIKTDHDFRVSAHEVKNGKKQTTNHSGVCGQCHDAHPERKQVMLWARDLGPAKDVQTSMCRSCHIKGNRLTKKHVPTGKHPDNVLTWNMPKRRMLVGDAPEAIPVYDTSGKRTSIGVISCPTCHNPHQWWGSRFSKGPGKESEGTSISSFLRKTTIGNIVCADCHGLDSLFRYQYFHSKTNTKDHPLYID